MPGVSKNSERLWAESARVRAEAIRIRIASGLAFCDVIQSETRWGTVEKAWGGMVKVQHAIQEITGHINEPRHVRPEVAQELRQRLAVLQERASEVAEGLEKRNPSTTVSPPPGHAVRRRI